MVPPNCSITKEGCLEQKGLDWNTVLKPWTVIFIWLEVDFYRLNQRHVLQTSLWRINKNSKEKNVHLQQKAKKANLE